MPIHSTTPFVWSLIWVNIAIGTVLFAKAFSMLTKKCAHCGTENALHRAWCIICSGMNFLLPKPRSQNHQINPKPEPPATPAGIPGKD